MTTLGKLTVVKGEIRAEEDVTVEGKVEGSIHCEIGAVVLGVSADVTGDIIARDITVFGRMNGQLVATDVVDIRAEATVTGKIVSARLIVNEGAHIVGRVEPQHLEAALRVAKFQQRKRESAVGQ